MLTAAKNLCASSACRKRSRDGVLNLPLPSTGFSPAYSRRLRAKLNIARSNSITRFAVVRPTFSAKSWRSRETSRWSNLRNRAMLPVHSAWRLGTFSAVLLAGRVRRLAQVAFKMP